MQQKVNRVLLVDDNHPDNIYHRIILEELDCVGQVDVVLNGEEALAFLQNDQDGAFPKPELILLDVNMPRMDGWEFLAEYKKLPESQKASLVVMMIAAPIDSIRHLHEDVLPLIDDFVDKPLSEEAIMNIVQEHLVEVL